MRRGLLLLLLLSGSTLAQEGERRFVREADSWYRVESYGRFLVDPRVVSLRLSGPLSDYAELLEANRLANGPQLAAAKVLRTNRLGVIDLAIEDGSDVLEALARLRATGRIEFAEENTFGGFLGTPNDPLFVRQWGLHNTGQEGGTPGADIRAQRAWDIATGLPSVLVAILDSGLDVLHQDLVLSAWIHPGEIPGNGVDDDGNGFVDDVNGWDFHSGNGDVTGPFPHGSAVGGVAGARTNDGFGLAGVADGFASSMPDGCRLQVLQIGDFGVTGSVVDDALLYAADHGARVANMSFFMAESSAVNLAIEHAFGNAGMVLVASSGNSGGAVTYPARHPRVVAVGATDRNDLVPNWSNRGPQLELAAPGEAIEVVWSQGGHSTETGTSFSAPHVSGAAALVRSVLPYTRNTSVLEILRRSAHDIDAPGFDERSGWGRLDAEAALLLAAGRDCNQNGIWDPEDIAAGTSSDADGDGIPDECGCSLPSSYCSALPNSAGSGAVLAAQGSASVGADDLVLTASGLPAGGTGLWFYGPDQIQLPFGDGLRCVGGGVHRLALVGLPAGGSVSHALQITSPPYPAAQIRAGDRWNFQLWYTDAGGASGFNLSDALTVNFCP